MGQRSGWVSSRWRSGLLSGEAVQVLGGAGGCDAGGPLLGGGEVEAHVVAIKFIDAEPYAPPFVLDVEGLQATFAAQGDGPADAAIVIEDAAFGELDNVG